MISSTSNVQFSIHNDIIDEFEIIISICDEYYSGIKYEI